MAPAGRRGGLALDRRSRGRKKEGPGRLRRTEDRQIDTRMNILSKGMARQKKGIGEPKIGGQKTYDQTKSKCKLKGSKGKANHKSRNC